MTLQERREQVVRAHIDAECRGDVQATLETFHHPRYQGEDRLLCERVYFDAATMQRQLTA